MDVLLMQQLFEFQLFILHVELLYVECSLCCSSSLIPRWCTRSFFEAPIDLV